MQNIQSSDQSSNINLATSEAHPTNTNSAQTQSVISNVVSTNNSNARKRSLNEINTDNDNDTTAQIQFLRQPPAKRQKTSPNTGNLSNDIQQYNPSTSSASRAAPDWKYGGLCRMDIIDISSINYKDHKSTQTAVDFAIRSSLLKLDDNLQESLLNDLEIIDSGQAKSIRNWSATYAQKRDRTPQKLSSVKTQDSSYSRTNALQYIEIAMKQMMRMNILSRTRIAFEHGHIDYAYKNSVEGKVITFNKMTEDDLKQAGHDPSKFAVWKEPSDIDYTYVKQTYYEYQKNNKTVIKFDCLAQSLLLKMILQDEYDFERDKLEHMNVDGIDHAFLSYDDDVLSVNMDPWMGGVIKLSWPDYLTYIFTSIKCKIHTITDHDRKLRVNKGLHEAIKFFQQDLNQQHINQIWNAS